MKDKERFGLLSACSVTGPTGPTGTTVTLQNALFTVDAVLITDGSTVPYATSFVNGSDISALSSTTFSLAAGHIYSVAYMFEATTAFDGYVFLTPRFNTVVQPPFGALAVTNGIQSAASANGTFFVDAAAGAIVLDFLFNGPVDATLPIGPFLTPFILENYMNVRKLQVKIQVIRLFF